MEDHEGENGQKAQGWDVGVRGGQDRRQAQKGRDICIYHIVVQQKLTHRQAIILQFKNK